MLSVAYSGIEIEMKMQDWQCYLVGGAVRDQLLKRSVHERDWVIVGATPEQLEAKGYRAVGKDFPVFLHPKTQEEYALARTERKTGKGYTGFVFHATPEVTLEEDLKRRDLTINAIAQDQEGNLIDPFNGQADLKARVLRHVSPAFAEDPVRILRVARFYARFKDLGFSIADETLELMRNMVQAGEVDALVPERVWQECYKALKETHPEAFIQALRECGALAILFPELDNLYGIPNPEKWHPEIDSGIHTEMVLQQAAQLTDDPKIRFSALVHDLGKACTPKDKLPSHPGHGVSGIPLVKVLCDRYKVPRDYRELAVLVSQWHIECHKFVELRPQTVLKILNQLDAFRRPDRFEAFLIACEADARGRTGFEDRSYPQAQYWKTVRQAAADIDIKTLVEQGYQHEALGEEIQKLRLNAIKSCLKTMTFE